MPDLLRIDGEWPAPVILSKGWARAYARLWNSETVDAFVRLERGSAEFLGKVSKWLTEQGADSVFSPALYESATRVWTKAGFRRADRLAIMERSLSAPITDPVRFVTEADPVWDQIEAIDRASFQGFWRMSLDGLQEALGSTRQSVLLTIGEPAVGYIIIGSQWGVAYLQRIAVHPDHSGDGLGSDLVRAGALWARKTSARTMILNVRDENEAARSLYSKEGFGSTTTTLQLLRYRK